MHYTDSKQLEHNFLNIVIYTHGQSGTDDIFFCTESIQGCQYFDPFLLLKILKNSNKVFSKFESLKNLKKEEYFLLRLKQTAYGKFEILNIDNVSENSNEFYRLH